MNAFLHIFTNLERISINYSCHVKYLNTNWSCYLHWRGKGILRAIVKYVGCNQRVDFATLFKLTGCKFQWIYSHILLRALFYQYYFFRNSRFHSWLQSTVPDIINDRISPWITIILLTTHNTTQTLPRTVTSQVIRVILQGSICCKGSKIVIRKQHRTIYVVIVLTVQLSLSELQIPEE